MPRLALVLLPLLLLALACGSVASSAIPTASGPVGTVPSDERLTATGDPAAGLAFDPCSLLRKAEVEAVVGQPLGQVYRRTKPDLVCEYYTGSAPVGGVTVRVRPGASRQDLDKEIANAEKSTQAKAEQLRSSAEAAYSVGSLLLLYQRQTFVLITAVVSQHPNLEAAERLAPLVLARLP